MIYVPVLHRETKPRKRLKWSTYYEKGRPRENHVKKFKIYKPPVKCKCFICGKIGNLGFLFNREPSSIDWLYITKSLIEFLKITFFGKISAFSFYYATYITILWVSLLATLTISTSSHPLHLLYSYNICTVEDIRIYGVKSPIF